MQVLGRHHEVRRNVAGEDAVVLEEIHKDNRKVMLTLVHGSVTEGCYSHNSRAGSFAMVAILGDFGC